MMPRLSRLSASGSITALAAVACLIAGSAVAPAWAQDQATSAEPAMASPTGPNDLLNATLWMQRSVEYKANSLVIYALGRVRLDEALADPSWSALDQSDAADKPAAIILDLDETAIDNSAYESGLVTTNSDYSSKTWDAWTKAEDAKAVPGVIDFLKYADSKGVKIFYITNRNADQEEATRANMEALGYPMGGNVDTFLMNKEKPEWTSDKTPRRDHVAKDYRVLELFGDNFNDFTDKASGTMDEREAAFEELKDHFGKDWFMLANPTYGSWESTAYDNNYKLSTEEKRAKKVEALKPWTPAAQ
ncbi:5'-nucleotidase, lipoprotein e(P4) family [Aurantimonas sp. VKM B-3413]|uniref:5'-nucleotidase, lipoprotein e(P4) family n=1 Tax=Aurantimonas sp. VKM B-3413 TaxID=2779401 RepID=UPI001E4BF31B|nr:5'-nucleotidase, lipoprotein e(P4) family [Aurantimonas sp. VKM B-3413]MCB8838392.1 5'-nucleotidase, lipoprotein e(P4) family [Aurantimonas sp. VKM B-3413]